MFLCGVLSVDHVGCVFDDSANGFCVALVGKLAQSIDGGCFFGCKLGILFDLDVNRLGGLGI